MSEAVATERTLTVAAGIAAAAVVVNAAVLLAPGLAILAVPFVAGLLLLRRHHGSALGLLAAGGLLHTVVAVNYVVAADSMDWAAGDYVGILVGGPAAAVTALSALASVARHRHHPVA